MQSVLATAFALAFFGLNFAQEWGFRRRQIDPRGEPPIGRRWFALAKLAMVLGWLAIVVQACGGNLRVVAVGAIVPWLGGFTRQFRSSIACWIRRTIARVSASSLASFTCWTAPWIW